MMTVTVGNPGTMFRVKEGLGVWEHRGKVAAVGVGHSPTARRWDSRPENTVGAWTILAIRRAIEDAGVHPSEVDGLAICGDSTTGAYWTPGQQVPQDFLEMFNQTGDPLDGLAKLSIDWILKNMPELKNIKFVMTAPTCSSMVLAATAQAVGDGLTNVCIAAKGWPTSAAVTTRAGPTPGPRSRVPPSTATTWPARRRTPPPCSSSGICTSTAGPMR